LLSLSDAVVGEGAIVVVGVGASLGGNAVADNIKLSRRHNGTICVENRLM
jgi:hypothetical protein